MGLVAQATRLQQTSRRVACATLMRVTFKYLRRIRRQSIVLLERTGIEFQPESHNNHE